MTAYGLILIALLGSTLQTQASESNTVSTVRVLAESALDADYIPFSSVVLATSGYQVHPLDTNSADQIELIRKLSLAASNTVVQVRNTPIQAARPNEAGNRIEAYVKNALEAVGLTSRTPVNSVGKAQSTGYPDIEITGEPHCYLELKTYSATARRSSQRTFYYSPSNTPKVTQDALHLLLAFQLEKEVRDSKTIFFPSRWELISLENLHVKMKLEFNQSNRGLYGKDADTRLIAEGEPSE